MVVWKRKAHARAEAIASVCARVEHLRSSLPGLTPDEAMLCAQAFSADNGGIDAVRRHCALQLSGAHAPCGIPLHERLSLATDLLNVANFPPGSHLQHDAEWAGALLEGILPQTLDALALTREQLQQVIRDDLGFDSKPLMDRPHWVQFAEVGGVAFPHLGILAFGHVAFLHFDI